MRIRPGLVSDLAAVEAIVKRAYGVYVERLGVRPAPIDADYAEILRRGELYIAESDGPTGLIVLIPQREHLFIENVAVDPNRQGAGIGHALLSYAEDVARQRRLPVLGLYTNAGMRENLAMYARLGYREQYRRTEDGFQRVFLSKRLA